jgi:transposase
MSNGADLADDVEALKALLVDARSLLAERAVEIEQLKAQIDKLRRMQFGRKSEQLQRQIETLETQLEDLAAGRGVADVQRAQARSANVSISHATTGVATSRQAFPIIAMSVLGGTRTVI